MKKFPIWCALVLLASASLHAQNNPNANPTGGNTSSDNQDIQGDKPEPNRFWQATLPGGHYMVQLDRISSISRHSYLLDGSVVVDEVTIDALGQALARFYQLRPLTDLASGSGTGAAASRLVDRGRDLIERTAEKFGGKASDMVVKKYPETTHAKTIEYRIETTEQLARLYASLRRAWETGRGRSFSLK